MFKYIRQLGAPLALSMSLIAGACDKGETDDTLAADSTLNRDLELASKDSISQPALKDVPDTPAPAASEPATKAPRPKPRPTTPTPKPTTPAVNKPVTTPSGNTVTPGKTETLGTIASGTTIALRAQSKVCTNTNKVGDRVTATVDQSVTGSNGATIPAGATVVLEVTQLDRSDNANDPIKMGFAVRSVTYDGKTYNLDADVQSASITRIRNSTKGNDAKKVIGGAVAGAVIGQILGKNTKGTVIGAAAGAAAGTAAAATTANFEGCVDGGAPIVIKLTAPATVSVAN